MNFQYLNDKVFESVFGKVDNDAAIDGAVKALISFTNNLEKGFNAYDQQDRRSCYRYMSMAENNISQAIKLTEKDSFDVNAVRKFYKQYNDKMKVSFDRSAKGHVRKDHNGIVVIYEFEDNYTQKLWKKWAKEKDMSIRKDLYYLRDFYLRLNYLKYTAKFYEYECHERINYPRSENAMIQYLDSYIFQNALWKMNMRRAITSDSDYTGEFEYR